MKGNNFDEAAFVESLREVVERLKTDGSFFDEVKNLRDIFKKTVPFGMRSYVGAYFASLQKGSHRSFSRPLSSTTKPKTEPHPRVEIPEDKAMSLFFNLGKYQRVSHSDLISLVMKNTDLARERIGKINIHPSYSFVQFYREDVEKVIEKLNGTTFRGRVMTVSLPKNQSGN